MQHTLATNIKAADAHRRPAELDNLSGVLDTVAAEHGFAPINRAGLAIIKRGEDGFFAVQVIGNGAILRDVVTALDQAGFLE